MSTCTKSLHALGNEGIEQTYWLIEGQAEGEKTVIQSCKSAILATTARKVYLAHSKAASCGFCFTLTFSAYTFRGLLGV